MRGRLRVDGRVFGENPTWLEVPDEFWTKRLPAGADLPMIPEPILAPGAETPAYGGTIYNPLCSCSSFLFACMCS
ncbi:hypothetical protein DCAR_0101661 [Daucus carota subsp. sativus]|uniref:Uncharacterized protein n=1 Tax=Daucus carota subsp. sativus TaxID=79200 RepID=A0A166GJZ4_DAUCS|nr:hypothetical protein DCAR_0101661 [Daucus carota subsp. sativus]